MGFLGWRSLGCPSRRPYQATPAFSRGLCAAYSHTILPPQQNPMMPSLDVSPFADFCAQATTASRSDITSASGTLETTFEIVSLMSGLLLTSPWRAQNSGAVATRLDVATRPSRSFMYTR